MPGPYDWHYDRNNDGKLDFFEQYEMDDDMDRFAKRGFYAEDDLGIDDPDDYDDDFDGDPANADVRGFFAEYDGADYEEMDFDHDDFDE